MLYGCPTDNTDCAGLGVYFYYGIKHSTLEEESLAAQDVDQQQPQQQQNIELTVTAEQPMPVPQQPVETQADLFIPAHNFPTWDD